MASFGLRWGGGMGAFCEEVDFFTQVPQVLHVPTSLQGKWEKIIEFLQFSDALS